MDVNWLSFILETLVAALLSGGIITFLAGLFLRRKMEQISAEVRQQVERELLRYRSTREWKERVLSELLGPMVMQLNRTDRAFKRWQSKNMYIESKIIKQGNTVIRDLLLDKGHLIPPDLLVDATRLVEHYDRWLEEYERVRSGSEPQLDEPFVFVGPAGFPFPSDAEDRFKKRFEQLWDELYGTATGKS